MGVSAPWTVDRKKSVGRLHWTGQADTPQSRYNRAEKRTTKTAAAAHLARTELNEVGAEIDEKLKENTTHLYWILEMS